MALQFEAMTPAGEFGGECRAGILNLRKYLKDEVLAGIPRYLYRYDDDKVLKLILEDRWGVTTSSDVCLPSTLTRQQVTCTVTLPNQERVSLGPESDELLLDDLLARFCQEERLINQPTLFLPNGDLDPGSPLSDTFLEFLLAETMGGVMHQTQWIGWNGNSSVLHQYDGILTQLDEVLNCEYYNPVLLDWAALTTGGTTAAPEDEMTVDELTIHGEVFTGLLGSDMADILKMWMERLMDFELNQMQLSGVEFEIWTPYNFKRRLAEMLACLQPCEGCVNPLSDPEIRRRAAEFIRTGQVYIYPYTDVVFTIKSTPFLQNRIIVAPKRINNRPTIGWVWRSQREEEAIAAGLIPRYGVKGGALPFNSLFPNVGENFDFNENDNFEAQAFSVKAQTNGDCLMLWVKYNASILIFARHLWLSFDNVGLPGLTPTSQPTSLPKAITDCVDVDDNTKTYTVASAAGISTGDTVSVHFADGQVFNGEATVAGNDITVNFFIQDNLFPDCTTFGGADYLYLLQDLTP